MADDPWYLDSEDVMREYAEAVALVEHLSGVPFDHTRPLRDWYHPDYMRFLCLVDDFKLRHIVSRALTDKAEALDCTFDHLKAACLAECDRRLAALEPPPEPAPPPAEPEPTADNVTWLQP
jgi:hypothetical protein